MNPEHRIEDEKMARAENNRDKMAGNFHRWFKYAWAIRELTVTDLAEQGYTCSPVVLKQIQTKTSQMLEEASESDRLRIWRAIEVRLRRRVLDLPRVTV